MSVLDNVLYFLPPNGDRTSVTNKGAELFERLYSTEFVQLEHELGQLFSEVTGARATASSALETENKHLAEIQRLNNEVKLLQDILAKNASKTESALLSSDDMKEKLQHEKLHNERLSCDLERSKEAATRLRVELQTSQRMTEELENALRQSEVECARLKRIASQGLVDQNRCAQLEDMMQRQATDYEQKLKSLEQQIEDSLLQAASSSAVHKQRDQLQRQLQDMQSEVQRLEQVLADCSICSRVLKVRHGGNAVSGVNKTATLASSISSTSSSSIPVSSRLGGGGSIGSAFAFSSTVSTSAGRTIGPSAASSTTNGSNTGISSISVGSVHAKGHPSRPLPKRQRFTASSATNTSTNTTGAGAGASAGALSAAGGSGSGAGSSEHNDKGSLVLRSVTMKGHSQQLDANSYSENLEDFDF